MILQWYSPQRSQPGIAPESDEANSCTPALRSFWRARDIPAETLGPWSREINTQDGAKIGYLQLRINKPATYIYIYIYICIWNVYVVCILYNTIYIDRYNLTLEISSVKYQLISTKSTLFRCIVFSWFITQGFSVQGWHCWSWHNPNAFQLYALCCSYLPTVTSSLISLCVDKYSTHGAYELVWTSCMYVHVKSPIHHDTSLFPLLKCQRCGMPHFFGEKNGFQILQVALEIALAHGFGPPVCVSCGCHCDPPARHVLCWAP